MWLAIVQVVGKVPLGTWTAAHNGQAEPLLLVFLLLLLLLLLLRLLFFCCFFSSSYYYHTSAASSSSAAVAAIAAAAFAAVAASCLAHLTEHLCPGSHTLSYPHQPRTPTHAPLTVVSLVLITSLSSKMKSPPNCPPPSRWPRPHVLCCLGSTLSLFRGPSFLGGPAACCGELCGASVHSSNWTQVLVLTGRPPELAGSPKTDVHWHLQRPSRWYLEPSTVPGHRWM